MVAHTRDSRAEGAEPSGPLGLAGWLAYLMKLQANERTRLKPKMDSSRGMTLEAAL